MFLWRKDEAVIEALDYWSVNMDIMIFLVYFIGLEELSDERLLHS